MAYPTPIDEQARLAELHALRILDTPAEPEFDGIARLAVQLTGARVGAVNFVDADRCWSKSLVGGGRGVVAREDSMCARAITRPEGTLVVRKPFYAAACIVSENGHALGTVCVSGEEARELEPEQLQALRSLAGQASALLALRRRTLMIEHLTDRLEQSALRDHLTGLPNRTLLMDRLQHALATHARKGRGLAVMVCDIDGFRAYNDCFGHETGDQVLHTVARRLKGAAREMDTVARLAGDEFAVLCPELTVSEDLVKVRRRLEQAVAQPIECGGCLVVPQVAVGMTVARHGDTVIEVLRRADHAMHAAKRASQVAIAF